MKHLWEVEHPYYCNNSQFEWQFKSWDDYLAQIEGVDDMDYNYLVRWDWYDENEPDMELKADCLHLTFVRQRKGELVTHDVTVSKEDEQRVLQWLAPRWLHMYKTWVGVSNLDYLPLNNESA